MQIFHTLSIRRKQISIIMLITSVALTLACAAFISFETVSFRREMVQNLSTLAKFIGGNTSAALDFNDPVSAAETLSALKSQPHIIGACVFSQNGSVFAEYDRPGDNVLFAPPQDPHAANHIFGKDRLALSEQITSKGDVIGTIYLESDMEALHTKLTEYAVTTAIVFILTLLVAFLLSARLQRLISEPILDLVRTARAVAKDKNYSIRVIRRNADEIGVLFDGFNEMLEQIQKRDAALQAVREDLKRRVEERTAELAESQSLYHSLVDQMPAGVFRKDVEGRFVFVNSWYCRIKGMIPDQILGKTPQQLAAGEFINHPESAKEIKLAMQGANNHAWILKTGKRIDVEEQYRGADGQIQHCQVVKSPVFGPDGKITGTQALFFDITAAKNAEAELSYERDLLRALLDNSPDQIYFKDLQSRFIKTSQAQAANFGVKSPDELLGKTDFDYFTEAHARPAFEDEQEIIRTGVPLISKLEKEARKDGRISWVLTNKMPLRNKDGQIIGTFGISKDITELKQAEDTLRESEERFSGAFEYAPIGVALVSPDGHWLKVNRAICDLLGYTETELLTRTFQELTHPDDLAPDLENVRRLLAGEIPSYQMEKRYVHAHGHLVTALLSVSLVRDGQGQPRYFISQIQDITERKRLEAQLFQSQKMETVGKLAGGVAHEFNSILTAIIGQSELLLDDLPAGSPLIKNADEITKAASRAAMLTRQLLAYGRKQFLQPEDLDLNRVIADMDGMLHHLMGGGVDVLIVPGAGSHIVKVDAGQIEQVIMNIVMNARDAMPHGGKLTLETAVVTFNPDSTNRYSELKSGNYVMLAITDTGTGMNEEVKSRAFEPFFSTKGVGQGTGLGLSTCYGIIKQSGGHISIYSEPGRGSTFKIYLPQLEPPQQISAQHPAPLDLPSGSETILLVEDDLALRDMASTLLRRLGYTVFAAGNGVEALSLQHERGTGEIDLLFTDVVMPHMSGRELADRVRVLYPRTKILFTSAYTENAIVHQGVLDKGVMLLQKPFTPSALAHKLREVLDQKKSPSN